MKKFVVVGIIALVLMAGGAAAFAKQKTASAQAVEPAAAAPERGVVSEGVVVPARWATVSSPAGGRVVEILVREGEQVAAGQPVLRVESSRQAAAVAQAEAALARAQARLAELQSGPRAEEVAVAESAVAVAQAQLARAQQGAKAEDVSAARAAVAAAQASLDKVLEGAAPGALIAAEADVAAAKATLGVAQAAYDKVAGNADVGAMPQALQLQQATIANEAAGARLADLQRGASKADVNGARARLSQAQAQLKALEASVRPADVAVAEAQVRLGRRATAAGQGRRTTGSDCRGTGGRGVGPGRAGPGQGCACRDRSAGALCGHGCGPVCAARRAVGPGHTGRPVGRPEPVPGGDVRSDRASHRECEGGRQRGADLRRSSERRDGRQGDPHQRRRREQQGRHRIQGDRRSPSATTRA